MYVCMYVECVTSKLSSKLRRNKNNSTSLSDISCKIT